MLNLLEKSLNHIAKSSALSLTGIRNFRLGKRNIGHIRNSEVGKVNNQHYALHSIYGWNLHLLTAIWGSLTNLLLHLGRPSSRYMDTEVVLGMEDPTDQLPSLQI